MARFIVLVPGDDEVAWEAASDEEKQPVYDSDVAFTDLLKQRGGRVTGGAELAGPSQARTLRHGQAGTTVTDGPYAETAEHLSGFYLVECGSLELLAECVQPMVEVHGVVEIRPVIAGGGS